MSRRSWILLGTLSALWGASYLFIKVALEDDVAPVVIVSVRTALAALVLLPLAAHNGWLSGVRRNAGPILVLAVVQMAGPLMLIAVGEQEISSSLTGILVATAPIFTFLLAFTLEGEDRASGLSLAGVVIGIGGVALLLGIDAGGGTAALVGGLCVVLASFGYGVGAWFVKRRVRDIQPVAMVGATAATAAALTAPFAALSLPSEAPGLAAVGSLLTLGVLCTGAAFVIFYSLVASDGPAKASLVGYIAPVFSIVYGVTLLDEGFTLTTAAGLLLITGGSWLAAEGRYPWQARSAAGGELATGCVDVAPAGEADGGPHSERLEGAAERVDRIPA
ncbi:MAG: DMT family transporter [Thermoleophilaceae bacterium]